MESMIIKNWCSRLLAVPLINHRVTELHIISLGPEIKEEVLTRLSTGQVDYTEQGIRSHWCE